MKHKSVGKTVIPPVIAKPGRMPTLNEMLKSKAWDHIDEARLQSLAKLYKNH